MKLGEYLGNGSRLAASEASTHYGRNGATNLFAEKLAAIFPWLRVIISLREPIRWGVAAAAAEQRSPPE